MAKRINITDPFASEIAPETADQQLYGAVNIGKSARRDKIRNLALTDIYPDVNQPRRALPSIIRQEWNPNKETVGAFLLRWSAHAGIEVQTYFGRNLEEGVLTDDPLQAALLPIVLLAASIHQSGLANPISVVQNGDAYAIETGERRWLAYHLLHALEPDDWSEIPARIVEELDVWRQAAENNARENLNAIGKARQLALLLMHVYAEQGVEFQPLSAFNQEQDFYAQVSDGNQFLIPRGMGPKFVMALGVKHSQQLREYRDLLRLPPTTWRLADDLDWAQGKIRALRRQADNDDQLESLAMLEAHREGYTVGIPTLDEIALPESTPDPTSVFTKTVKGYTGWLLRNAPNFDKLTRAERDKAIKHLNALQSWLDDLRDQLR